MAERTKQKKDLELDTILQAVAGHKIKHPRAQIEGYRQSSASVRIRIIDPDFAGVSRWQRHEDVWRLLESLPEDVMNQVTVLLLLTPQEKKKSLANLEFEEPTPSTL